MKFKVGDIVMVKTKKIHAFGEIKNGMVGDVINIIPYPLDTYINNRILVQIPVEVGNGKTKNMFSWFNENELEFFIVPNKEDKMEERKFEVLMDKTVIASNMVLSDAIIFMEAYIKKYYATPRLIMSIRKMEEN